MNIDGIKSALAKIPAWVKKNPKAAAAVAVVIVVIAYFAIKRGASYDGSGSSASDGESLLDSAGGGLGAGGGGGSSEGLPAGSGLPAGEVTTTTTTEESSGGGGGFGDGLTSDDFSIGGGSGLFSSSIVPAYNAPSAAILAAPASRGLSDTAKPSVPAPAPVAFRPASQMVKASSVLTNTGIGASANQLTRVTTPAPKVSNTVRPSAPAPVVRTDAQKAGLSRFFTGTSAGRRYVAGVFVGNAPAPVKKSNTVAPAKKKSGQVAKR